MDRKYIYRLTFSGIILNCCFNYPETAILFDGYTLGKTNDTKIINIADKEWEKWIKDGGRKNPAAEFTCFTSCISDALLSHNRIIIHAVCFRYHDFAWLICAGSGVGKTTQIKTLMDLYPGKFSVICGDRPILEVKDTGMVIAHPSPWNGKEGMHNADSAPLAGILCLERGEITELKKMSEQEAIIPVMKSIISSFGTAEIIHDIAGIENTLLKNVPVWRYVNGGVPDSSKYLYETLLRDK